MTRVGLCDTQPVMALGLGAILKETRDLQLVWSTYSLEEAQARNQAEQADVLIIDKAFGINNITSFSASWNGVGKTARVIWGAGFTETEVLRLIQAEVRGIILRSAEPEKLVACLSAARSGQTWIEEGIFRSGAKPRPQMNRYGLTPRESEVFRLVRIGLTNNEIAEELGIRPGTVKIHLKHLYEKTGLRGRFQLALATIREPVSLEMTA